jgi:hypothetical protein
MKVLQLTALDGSKWNIPATVIAESFRRHYGENEEPDDGDLKEWAGNEMNWSDVSEHAVQVKGADKVDMQDSWNEGDFEITDVIQTAARDAERTAPRPANVNDVAAAIQPFAHIALVAEQIDALALTVKVKDAMTRKDYLDLFFSMRHEAATILAGVEPGDHSDAIIAAFGERAARVAILRAVGLPA